MLGSEWPGLNFWQTRLRPVPKEIKKRVRHKKGYVEMIWNVKDTGMSQRYGNEW